MAQNFIECDREQLLLMSASLREWLPENHLACFVIDAVKDIDLSPFYARYREDGWGRAAYDPAMMVAIVLYAYCKGQRSSRGIERACVEDIAYRVIASNLAPDHVTINRFRSEHTPMRWLGCSAAFLPVSSETGEVHSSLDIMSRALRSPASSRNSASQSRRAAPGQCRRALRRRPNRGTSRGASRGARAAPAVATRVARARGSAKTSMLISKSPSVRSSSCLVFSRS